MNKFQENPKYQISNPKIKGQRQRVRLGICHLGFSSPRSRRGVALITVLAVLVLLTIVVVGFLFHARSNSTAVNYYRATANTRVLADTAINLVQAQINEATMQPNSAWASQPGAIRVFNNSGGVINIHKLYSAKQLTTNGTADLANDVPQPGWSGSDMRPLWVDLNAPAIGADGKQHFPILDARSPAGNSMVTLDGFSISGAPDADNDNGHYAPMPVRWLYVLQEGQIIAPDAGGNGATVTFSGASAPTSKNPIVGRIAFWTDDNTCKININTAGGQGLITNGNPADAANKTFWDTPHFASTDERGAAVGNSGNFANSQPVKGEYQRYPGHPATTNLQNTLAGLGFSNMDGNNGNNFYRVTPRYNSGGSQGNTIYTANSHGTAIANRADRLYSSVAEMLFSATVSGAERTPSVLNSNADRQRVETANFFLTAHSRAPELNLFGQPRISIWPVSDNNNTTYRTVYDNLLAFAATTGSNKAYYFTRAADGATNSTRDIMLPRNAALLDYLDRLANTSIPGFGGSFNAKYPGGGEKQILTEIFDYVRTTNRFDLGIDQEYNQQYGGTSDVMAPHRYAQRWIAWDGYGFGQIAPSKHPTWKTQGVGAYPRLVEVTLQFITVGQGFAPATTSFPPKQAKPVEVVPLKVMNWAAVDKDPAIIASGTGGNPPDNTSAIQAVLMLSFVNPSYSSINGDPWLKVKVEGLNALTVNGTPLNFPATASMNIHYHVDYMGSSNSGYWPSMFMFHGHYFGQNTDSDNWAFPFYSKIFTVPFNRQLSTVQTMTVGSPTAPTVPVTITLYDANGSSVVQEYRVDIPNFTSPVPGLPNYRMVGPNEPYNPSPGTDTSVLPGPTADYNRWQFRAAAARAGTSVGKAEVWFDNNDVTRSMILAPEWSDPRVLTLDSVPASAFVPHPWWNDTNRNHAHYMFYQVGLFNGNSAAIDSAQTGRLVKNAAYTLAGNAPALRLGMNGLAGTGGQNDWDTGTGWLIDGPWTNKADEGVADAVDGNGEHFPYFFSNVSVRTSLMDDYFSPNRQIPSPVMFGSLPTGVNASGGTPRPWQTLLFRPKYSNHPGGGTPGSVPADHLLLDWFWMPVVEPYAISEPFSTDGKVNLNYQIVPFTYITRATALRAALASIKVAKLPANLVANYKSTGATTTGGNTRLPLNLDATVSQFDQKFASSDVFKSASEICDLYLVPQGYELAGFKTQFDATDGTGDFAMIGDNVRERPYAHLYSRLTTKSNAYTVYYTVQTLKNANPNPAEWDETRGAVTGEYRGSTMLERYLDPNTAIRDFTDSTNANYTLENDYRWRVISNTQFAP